MRRVFGILMVVFSAFSFGVMPIFARRAYADGLTPNSLLFFRFFLASIFMVLVMKLGKRKFPRGKTLLLLAVMGGIGYVGQSFCYFNALNHASAGVVALLLYIHPTLVTLLSRALYKERLTGKKTAALLLSSAGAALIIGFSGSSDFLGIVLGVSAALIYSVYIIAGHTVIDDGRETEASAVIMISAAVVYLVLAVSSGPAVPSSAAGWLSVLGIALVSTVAAILAFFLGLKRIGPATTTMISTLEPAVTMIFAALLLGETVAPVNILGGVMILGAVLFLAKA